MLKSILGIPISRLSLFVFLTLAISYSKNVFGKLSRQGHRVTITAANIALGEVFKRIHLQTGLTITNNFEETNLSEEKRVSINFVHTDISEVMTFLLNDKKDLSFILNGKAINIFKGKNQSREILSDILNKTDTIASTFQLVGKITDISGIPIPGATVKVKNSNQGTISNPDGSFHLSNIELGMVVSISSIGFETKDIIIDEKSMSVKLNSYTNILDEKIIIAYGSTTKRLNTGNVSSVKAKDIEMQPVSNPLAALQGRVPGIQIQQASGLPNSGFTVRIQGINSYSSGNDPFYVIDGVPYISQLLPINNQVAGGSGVLFTAGNPLNYLNLGDIESIEILKDADATSIYGSRAANGAVLITTKKGRPGETKIDVRLQKGWSKVPRKLDLLNNKDYLLMRHEALKNDGITTLSPFDWDLNGTWDTTRNIDWQKELIGRSAQYTDANLSFSGGTAQTQFLIGTGYHKETTVFPGSFSDTKGSLHFNITNNSFDQRFKMQLSASYMFDNNKLPRTDLTQSALTLIPIAPDPYKPDGSINWMPNTSGASTYYYNPLAQLAQFNTNKTANLVSNAVIGYEILPGITIRSNFGYNSLTTNELGKTPNSIYPPETAKYISLVSTFLNNRISSWVIEPQIEMKYNIKKGKVNALIGSNITQQNSEQEVVYASGFNSELNMEDLASASKINGATIKSVYKYNALYGRLTYNWMDKYIINLSARRDGSSRFGPESQFHNFGSVAGAWIFSEESFTHNALRFLSFGKLRASFGTTGNDQIGDYQFLDLYNTITIPGTSYQNVLGLEPTRITNPYLQWEETKKLQMGIELGFIQDKILLTVNYNRNRSSNQLIFTSIPLTTGFSNVLKNFPAVIQNTGWEFTVNTTNIKTKNFTWTSNINLTIPKNQLLSYFGQDKNNSISIGKPITLMLLFKYVGVNDTTGIYEFRDSKGNLTPAPSDPVDKTTMVNPDPKFYGGFQNNFSYKGVSLSFLLQFTKRKGFDYTYYAMTNNIYPGFLNYGKGNQSKYVLDRWQKNGDEASHALFSSNSNSGLYELANSDAVWVDASYIRLKNLSLSWQIPYQWRKKAHINNLSIFMNIQNLLTITSYKGLDPETMGLGLPPLRTVSIGAQITL